MKMMQSVETLELCSPPLEEVAEALKDGMSKNFSDLDVDVVDCPDLTKAPFFLAAKGLGSATDNVILDIGGPGNLVPTYNLVHFDYNDIVKRCGLKTNFLVGPGCCPIDIVGGIGEFVTNIDLTRAGESRVITVNDNGVCEQRMETEPRCSLMMNLLASDGAQAPVIRLVAKGRTGTDDLLTSLRLALAKAFGTRPVALGGAFLIDNGTAHLHCMPKQPASEPLETPEAVDKWLTWHDVPGPLVNAFVVVSHDPGFDLRVDHAHCFVPPGTPGAGGHYHYDISPKTVEYTAYLTCPNVLKRVDRPVKK